MLVRGEGKMQYDIRGKTQTGGCQGQRQRADIRTWTVKGGSTAGNKLRGYYESQTDDDSTLSMIEDSRTLKARRLVEAEGVCDTLVRTSLPVLAA